MKFPYTKFPCEELKPYHPSKSTFRPLVPITVLHGSKSFVFAALLDTGADYNLMPLEVAEVLGINLSGCPALTTKGIGGELRTFFAPIRIRIAERGRAHKIDTYASFGNCPTPLLGQNGFLDKIKSVTFSYPDFFEIGFRK